MKLIRYAAYIFIQSTWGVLQTLAGFFLFLKNLKCRHYFYHGAVVTEWASLSSVSLGEFVFVSTHPPTDRRSEGRIPDGEMPERLLVHEYGHTIQSLIFGPLYLLAMGLPSALWANLPVLRKKRALKGTSYYGFYTERLANGLGERATKKKSMENAVI